MPHELKLQPLEIVPDPLQLRLALNHLLLGEIIRPRRFVGFRRSNHFDLNVAQYCEQAVSPQNSARSRRADSRFNWSNSSSRCARNAPITSCCTAPPAAALITTVGDELRVIDAPAPLSFENRPSLDSRANSRCETPGGGMTPRIDGATRTLASTLASAKDGRL